VSIQYTDLQLDALRELANIGSGNASTALSAMVGRAVDISVPNVRVLPLPEAVEATGPAEAEVTGIVLGVVGDMEATVLLLIPPADAGTICRMLGLEPDDEYALSALGEVGNVVGTSYINALAAMTSLDIEPTPPSTATDMQGAIVQTVLANHAEGGDVALLLDSNLDVEGEDCSISFVLVPNQGGVDMLLERLGMA
jgi:chemotaxis protein CheC